MDFTSLLNSHRSIREYKETQISEELLDEILHAATKASSSGNIQPYSIIISRDKANREKLWELHYKQDMILQVPIVLTFCVDWHRMTKWCEISDAHPTWDNFLCYMVGAGDVFIAAQNAALTAEAAGLGVCYMGTTLNNAQKLSDFFECPKNVVPVTSMVIGYPDEDPDIRDRLPMEAIIHQERYVDYSNEDILKHYKQKEEDGWNRYMSFPELKAKIEKSGVKNLAQVYTDVKYTKDENRIASQSLLELLKTQNFLNQ